MDQLSQLSRLIDSNKDLATPLASSSSRSGKVADATHELIAAALVSASNSNSIEGNNPELDSIILSHRRKMQRRQANRRSAQLSRARKKAHLEELKVVNQRLQHICDMLDSQPEFIFAFNCKGSITYMPERLKISIKSAQISNLHLSGEELEELEEEEDKDISHVTQILTPESVNILYESIKELNGASNSSYATSSQLATFVKEVYYQDATGFPVAGFMRCSKVIKGTDYSSNGKGIVEDIYANEDIGNPDGPNSDTDSNENEKKRRKTKSSLNYISHSTSYPATRRSQSNGNNSNSSSDHTSNHSSNNSNGSDYGGRAIKLEHEDGDDDSSIDSYEEFVAVIRPVSSSTPYGTNNLHLLSAASMVTHNEYSSDTSSGKDVKNEYSSLTSGERTTQSHGSSDEGSSTKS